MKPFMCKYCHDLFKTKNLLRIHKKTCVKRKSTKASKYETKKTELMEKLFEERSEKSTRRQLFPDTGNSDYPQSAFGIAVQNLLKNRVRDNAN